MDIAAKLTLIAAIIYFGYNMSEILSSYEKSCEKVDAFKKLKQESDSSETSLRRSNFLLSFLMMAVFVSLIHFSGIAFWVTFVVAVKCLLTLYCSDTSLVNIIHSDVLPKKTFLWTKVDAVFNALFGLAIALIVVV